MGAWGAGPFDNDDAADFLGDLRQGDDIELQLARCLRLANADYLEAPEGSAVVAAAAVIALRCSGEVDAGAERWSEAVADIAIKQTQAYALAVLARGAIARVQAPGSELADLWTEADPAEWVAEVAAIERSLRGVEGDGYQDWAPYPDLTNAATVGLRDPKVALDALRAVVDISEVSAFVLDREPAEQSEGLWQEVALTDGRRLVMWHGEDKSGLIGSSEFTSSIRVIPLGAITDRQLKTTYQQLGTERSLLAVELWLSTVTPEKSRAVSISETEWEVQDFYFAKSIVDGGLAQMERLLQFGRAVAQRV
ncbi:hypothetical protein AOT83_09975 [Mycobacteroides sp. H001]|uniref:DUF4259 domain-containing protein n=1 Tax=Mycobacteroides TaxID=670516 RepID=UPI000712E8FF|nr:MULTISPECIES: DUF4259 domain-containing protein [Mycobacteroides]KRQ22769.1 hypothetical protein AOT86_19075 [Mycobacteroides sp. H072]KRQ40360.1 hypothetical protein AOT84_04585 [Mycobacteroides sp. H002]KRQ47619.1 hypothetical protein AOT85_21370 [Mycobacteroides sp. H054]KRQ70882.1 hypothetical protein AOT83_09975 [Mycobacteroides sp. H001]